MTGTNVPNSWVLADSRPEADIRSFVYRPLPLKAAVTAKSARAPSDRCKFSRNMAAFVCAGKKGSRVRSFEIATLDLLKDQRLLITSKEGGKDVVSEWLWEASRNGYDGTTIKAAPLAMYPAFTGTGVKNLPVYNVEPVSAETFRFFDVDGNSHCGEPGSESQALPNLT